jgi:hypothetical protein
MIMRQLGMVTGPFGLMVLLVLAAFLTSPGLVVAGPGDVAADQSRYPAIQGGAKQFQKAIDVLEKGRDRFRGHRVAAAKHIREALTELDVAVKLADKKGQSGEKTRAIFQAKRGKLAAAQSAYPAIRDGANQVIEAGKALDKGLDKFGGHRVKALKALNVALDELETAVKKAR